MSVLQISADNCLQGVHRLSDGREIKQGSHYFRALCQTILDYANHPEHKFDGDIGLLERKHIVADGVVHIGKEANSVNEQALDVKRSQVFVNELELREFIQNISYSDWVKKGYSKGTLHNLKQDANSGSPITMNAHVRERIHNI